MKIAIMQPYIFPYIGYFQLASMVDHFIFYDDIAFIKQGYINRNNILINGKKYNITFPVKNISSNRNINEHYFVNDFSKQLKTISQSYSKSPNFKKVFPLIEMILSDKNRNVSSISSQSIISVMDYLSLPFEYSYSSDYEYDRTQSAEKKIISMSNHLHAEKYINSIGGVNLYNRDNFINSGIELFFLKTVNVKYLQDSSCFVPNLSIIDILMWCSKEEVRELLQNFVLTNGDIIT